MQIIQFTFVHLGITFALMSPAFAYRGDAPMAMTRQSEASNRVTVEGNLICETLKVKTSSEKTCDLKIQDRSTGKVYRLASTESTLKLFESGIHEVAIEGRFSDFDLIEIKNAQKL